MNFFQWRNEKLGKLLDMHDRWTAEFAALLSDEPTDVQKYQMAMLEQMKAAQLNEFNEMVVGFARGN